MKKLILGLLFASAFATLATAAELNDQDKEFLAGYEKVRTALAADNLADAKAAAADIKEGGADLAKTDSLIMARKEFAKMSDHAITLAKGQPGLYVVNCPMLKKDWVQTSEKIANPYAGREMLTCGMIKK